MLRGETQRDPERDSGEFLLQSVFSTRHCVQLTREQGQRRDFDLEPFCVSRFRLLLQGTWTSEGPEKQVIEDIMLIELSSICY